MRERTFFQVTLISPNQGPLTGRNHDVDKADSFKVDLPLDQANPADFDALMLPGGSVNADHLRMNQKAQNFAKQWQANGDYLPCSVAPCLV